MAHDVERGLAAMGFELRKQGATSHRHWVGTLGGKFRKVTVDPPKQPFSPVLIKIMATVQAGITVAQFYEICSKEGQKKAKKGELRWLNKLMGNTPICGAELDTD